MSHVMQRFWLPCAATLAGAYLVVMLITGALPERQQMVRPVANGVLRLDPAEITRVTVFSPEVTAVFVRRGNHWISLRGGAAVAAPLGTTLERAVKFMHTGPPVRKFETEDNSHEGLAKFGLDHPSVSVMLENESGIVLTADFGNSDNDGLLRYMRLRSADDIYLMSGFVGKEWDAVVDAIKP